MHSPSATRFPVGFVTLLVEIVHILKGDGVLRVFERFQIATGNAPRQFAMGHKHQLVLVLGTIDKHELVQNLYLAGSKCQFVSILTDGIREGSLCDEILLAELGIATSSLEAGID